MGKILSETHAGPDDPIYKGGLRVSSVLGPSALTKNSPGNTDGTSPSSAPNDPTLFDPNKPAPAVDMDDPVAMGQLQDYLDEHIRKLDEKEGLISKAPASPGSRETT